MRNDAGGPAHRHHNRNTPRFPFNRRVLGGVLALAAALIIVFVPEGGAQSKRASRERSGETGATLTGQILVYLPGGRGQRQVSSLASDGQDYVASADIIDILRATSYWRSETRKLLLRVGEHRVTLAVGNPFVLIDRQVLRLPARPLLRDGQVWAPAALFDLLGRAGVTPGATWDSERRVLSLGAGQGTIGALSFRVGDGRTALSLAVADDITPSIVSAHPGRLVVRLHGAVASEGMLGERDVAGRFLRAELTESPGGGGVDLTLDVSDSSRGYVVRRLGAPPRVEVMVADETGLQGDLVFQPFGAPPAGIAAAGGEPRIPDRAAFVVIDPGHGGEDMGTRSHGGKLEKHLTLELAKRVQRHLQHGAGFRVMLVRERDERIDVPRRLEIANGAGADLFLSLHLDLGADRGSGHTRGFRLAVRPGGGQVLYEDLGALVPGVVAASDVNETLSLVRWEAAGAEHGVESQRLAQNIAAGLKAKFPREPAQVLHRPVWSLEGADMPAVLVEFAAPGDAGTDRAMASGETLESLAKAVAAGVMSYWAGERPGPGERPETGEGPWPEETPGPGEIG